MRELIDYDPWTLTSTYHEYDEKTDTNTIIDIQDIEPSLQAAYDLRKDDDYTRKGIKNDMWHYANIPASIITRMKREDGVDIFNKAQKRDLMKLLNTKYSFLKTTRKRHV